MSCTFPLLYDLATGQQYWVGVLDGKPFFPMGRVTSKVATGSETSYYTSAGTL